MKLLTAILLLASVGCDRSSQAVSNAPRLPRTVEGSGVIRGSVQFIGTAPQMKTISVNERCCAGEPALTEETVVVNPNSTLRNVFVYLEDAPKTDGSAQPAALLDQVRCRYLPHVLGVQVGQTLTIRSSDPTMHNVHFAPDRNKARNLAMTSVGHEVPTTFTAAEFVRMKCDVHPWMTAWVGVFENPFYSVTETEGVFEIRGIPAGTYKLVAWHELYGRQEQRVTIADEKPIELKLTFGKAS